MKSLTASEGQTDRVLINKFMWLHPDCALSVHIFSIENIAGFCSIVQFRRTVATIFNIRNTLRHLNIDYNVPVPDLYTADDVTQKRQEKGALHLTRMFDRMERERDLMNMRLCITSRSIETVKGAVNQSSLSVKEITHRAIMTAQLELGLISGRKRRVQNDSKPKGKGIDIDTKLW